MLQHLTRSHVFGERAMMMIMMMMVSLYLYTLSVSYLNPRKGQTRSGLLRLGRFLKLLLTVTSVVGDHAFLTACRYTCRHTLHLLVCLNINSPHRHQSVPVPFTHQYLTLSLSVNVFNKLAAPPLLRRNNRMQRKQLSSNYCIWYIISPSSWFTSCIKNHNSAFGWGLLSTGHRCYEADSPSTGGNERWPLPYIIGVQMCVRGWQLK